MNQRPWHHWIKHPLTDWNWMNKRFSVAIWLINGIMTAAATSSHIHLLINTWAIVIIESEAVTVTLASGQSSGQPHTSYDDLTCHITECLFLCMCDGHSLVLLLLSFQWMQLICITVTQSQRDEIDLPLSELMNIQHHIRVIDIWNHEWIAEFCHMIWSVMPASVTASHLACPQLWLSEAKWVSPWHQGRHNKAFKSGNWAMVVEAKQS